MSEPRSRLRGRAALERSLRAVLMRAHRVGRARATPTEDVRWCARLIDALTALLALNPSGRGVPRCVWEGEATPAQPREETTP